MGLAVHHAEVVRDDGLGGGVGGFGIAAILAGVHFHKAVMGQLRADTALHAVTLKGGIFLLERAKAESAILPAGGGDAVVGVIHLLDGDFLGQFLEEVCRAVIEPIYIFTTGVVGGPHVGVEGAAGLAHRLCPVVAGVVGILAGGAVQQVALALPVQASAV